MGDTDLAERIDKLEERLLEVEKLATLCELGRTKFNQNNPEQVLNFVLTKWRTQAQNSMKQGHKNKALQPRSNDELEAVIYVINIILSEFNLTPK